MKNKKAEGLPIQTIVVIIIILIVFLLILLVFNSQFSSLWEAFSRLIKSVIGLGEINIQV